MDPMDSGNPEVAQVGLRFVRALVEGRYEAAHTVLAPSLRDDLQAADLKAAYEQMIDYWDAPASTIELLHVDGRFSGGTAKVNRISRGSTCR